MLNTIRKPIKYLARPRQFMYLLALLAVAWLYAFYVIYENKYNEAEYKYRQYEREQFFKADPGVIRDTRLTQNYFDGFFEMQTDRVVKYKKEGEEALLVSVCATECWIKEGKDVCGDRCKVASGLPKIRNLCLNNLSTSREFHKHRVYDCRMKIRLDGDEPLSCIPYTWREFKTVCTKLNNT